MKQVDSEVETHFYAEDTTGIEDPAERLSKMLDAKCAPADLNKMVSGLKHLISMEKSQLKKLLEKCKELFDGTVGTWKGKPYRIQLKEGATPHHSEPHTIPKAYKDVLKNEVKRLVKIGMLRGINHSEWAAPSFVIPKKDHMV